MYYFGPQAQRH